MTKREFLDAIVNADVAAEIIEFAESELTKMDEANAKRRAKNDEKAIALKPFLDKFAGYLSDEPLTASDIAAKMESDGVERPDGKAINTQWVTSLGRKLVDAGIADKVDVKVPKKGTQKGYIAC